LTHEVGEGRDVCLVTVNEKFLSTSIVLFILLVVAGLPQSSGASSKGPRTEVLINRIYSSAWETYAALEAGEVDIVSFEIVLPVYLEAIGNPNVALAPVDDMGMYEFDLHNNYSIHSYPGIRSPTSYTEFRQALTFLVDKDRVVEEFCDGFAVRIDQPIASPTHFWMNKSYTGANYPYAYDPAAASALLDANGWVQGGTPNPYYDAAFPGSTPNLRTYPVGHETAGADVDPVITYVRTDDARRLQAGRHLYGNMRKIGIPVDAREGPSSFTYDPVMGLLDYHIYTGGWSLGRFPTFPYFAYHTDYYQSYYSNIVTGYQANNLTPAHPRLDTLLENLYYADTFDQAYHNCQLAMGLFTELCVTIPLFSARYFYAYSTTLLGAVNMDSYGFENDFFFMNVYKADGSPIIWGMITPPNALNIMYEGWLYDMQCLWRVNLFAGFDLPPYNIAADQPSWVLDWYADTWVDPDDGQTKAKNFKQFRPDNYFCDTGGNQLENVDADAYLFSCYLQYAAGISADRWSTVQDLKRFTKVNDYYVDIYYDARSYWLYTSASPCLYVPSVWKNQTYGLTMLQTTCFTVDTNLTTPGFLGLDRPVWINSITGSSSGLLEEWVDYHWELGDFKIDTALVSGETVNVEWYQFGVASGYTLGGNPLEQVFLGCGMYYFTGFISEEGGGWYSDARGNCTYERNPFYYLETPVLGEVDFVWEDGGYYEVTIFDIVKAAGAYGSQGTGVPDSNWFPGADLAPPGGVIDIFDIVTIAGKYGQTFGASPP
jgi:hypothetical protein